MKASVDSKKSSTMKIVHPAAEEVRISLNLAPRLASLKGKKIALVDNTKHMASVFLGKVKEILQDKYGVTGFEYYRKAHASVPIPVDVMQRLTASCDAVVHGVAD